MQFDNTKQSIEKIELIDIIIHLVLNQASDECLP